MVAGVVVLVCDVIVGFVGSVSGFFGTGYSYPVTASSEGHNEIPKTRNSGFLPIFASSSGIQSGTYAVVVVVIAGVEVEAGVVVVDFFGSAKGFFGTGYSYPVTAPSEGHNGTPESRN